MFNNDVTYHKKWDTEENKLYQKKVYKLLRGKTHCMSDCPVSWAKEVYQLLTHLDKEFGIRYSLPYIVDLRPHRVFMEILINPWKHMLGPRGRQEHFKKYEPKNWFLKMWKRLNSVWWSISSNARRTCLYIKAGVINYIKNPKLQIDQIKEKYGSLRFYDSTPEWLSNYVEEKVRETEIKLAVKGAYFPPEELFNWASSWWDKENTYKTQHKYHQWDNNPREYYTEVTHYGYRKLMKNMKDIVDYDDIVRKVQQKVKK